MQNWNAQLGKLSWPKTDGTNSSTILWVSLSNSFDLKLLSAGKFVTYLFDYVFTQKRNEQFFFVLPLVSNRKCIFHCFTRIYYLLFIHSCLFHVIFALFY